MRSPHCRVLNHLSITRTIFSNRHTFWELCHLRTQQGGLSSTAILVATVMCEHLQRCELMAQVSPRLVRFSESERDSPGLIFNNHGQMTEAPLGPMLRRLSSGRVLFMRGVSGKLKPPGWVQTYATR